MRPKLISVRSLAGECMMKRFAKDWMENIGSVASYFKELKGNMNAHAILYSKICSDPGFYRAYTKHVVQQVIFS